MWALFDRADKALKDEAKDSISKWLLGLGPSEGNQKWPGQFIQIFDSVFGERHLSWKCFFRSCVASYFAITIMLLVYIGIHGTGEFVSSTGQINWIFFADIYFAGGMLNLLPDYVSLLETRFVLHRMKSCKPFPKIVIFLCLDLVISSLLIVWSFLVFLILISPDEIFSAKFNIEFADWIINGISFSGENGPLGIFIYSTFFTSVWLWLYGLSGFLLKTSQRMGRAFDGLKNILDFENKPLPSLGLVSNFITLFFYIVGFGFFYDGKYL